MGTSKASRTPRPAAKTISSTSASKKKLQPSGSILSYFKKSCDESMFLGNGHVNLDVQEDDLFEDEDIVDGSRYNEVDSPVKKRRLDSAVQDPTVMADTSPDNITTPPTNRNQPRKLPNNPFLEDSSDEEDEMESRQPGPEESLDDDTSRPKPELSSRKSRESPSGKEKVAINDDTDGQIRYPSPLAMSVNEDSIDKVPRLKHEPSTIGDLEAMAGFNMDPFAEDDDFAGEEFRMMQYMEEQARLEAEELGNYSCDDDPEQANAGSSMTPTCPICDGSLARVSPEDATKHVNACLDGNPTPLPTLSNSANKPVQIKLEAEEVDAPEIGKRFARAAQPRPGQANPISLGDATGPGSGPNSAFTKLMSGHAEDAAWAAAAAAEHVSRGKPAYQRTCPFYKIMPGFFICVDAFRYGAVEGCRAYFLSHFHSDHYVGLTANWTHGPIYCSRVTGSLVKSQLRTAAQYVVELEFEEKVPIPGTDGAFVTMIPANHCPGSSLFLFEKVMRGRTQRILHCGDFRACPAHANHPGLRAETVHAVTGKTKQQTIDVCYLDTTYLNPRYSFPPQEDVIQACADLCVELDKAVSSGSDEWDALLCRREGTAPGQDSVSKFFTAEAKASAGDKGQASIDGSCKAQNAFTALDGKPRPRLLVICGTYSIGKERICKAIAQALGSKIFASAAKARMVAQLGDPELTALLTPNPAEAQVHMQMLMEIRAETLEEYLDAYHPHFSRIVGFRPSGWNFRPTAGGTPVNANLPPTSVPTTQILHGSGWRARFAAKDLRPQRGSSRLAMCFGAPYSEHSSFRELALFLMALRIERVVPTVNVGSEPSRRRMKGWIDRWLAERRRGGLVRVLEEPTDEEGEIAASATGNGGGKKNGLWDGKDGKGGGVYW